MRSASTASLLLVLLGARGALGEGSVPAAPPRPVAVVVGLVPSGEALVDRDLLAGLELALLTAIPPDPAAFVIRVGKATATWGSAGEGAVDLVRREGALALVGPPARAVGHLLAQVCTRLRVPLLSTSGAPSVTGSGSRWAVRVVAAGEDFDRASTEAFVADTPDAERFVAAYRARCGREPSRAGAAGYDAGQALRLALERSAGAGGAALKGGLLGLTSIPGARGRFDLSATGQRIDPPPGAARGGS